MSKILLLARLWNPDDVTSPSLKSERETINKKRIAYIRACRKEFSDQFIGGLQGDDFSRLHAKDLVMPDSLTRRKNFLQLVKQSDICIATTGLHDSIGWKFAEYVAASRAVISEPLMYQLPGNFESGKNYLTYTNKDELVMQIHFLLDNKKSMKEMMDRNFEYYHDYVSSDKLVLNTLLKIL